MTLKIKHSLFGFMFCCLLCSEVLLSSCGVEKLGETYSAEKQDLLEFCDEPTKKMLQVKQTPILLRYSCLRETSEEYEITDITVINAVLQAIFDIHVKKDTGIAVTDYDDIFIFVAKDGVEYVFSFNGHHFQANGKIYELSDDEELWKLAKDISQPEDKKNE